MKTSMEIRLERKEKRELESRITEYSIAHSKTLHHSLRNKLIELHKEYQDKYKDIYIPK